MSFRLALYERDPVAADQVLALRWGEDAFDARSVGGGMQFSRVY